jgi:hypothetical protein
LKSGDRFTAFFCNVLSNRNIIRVTVYFYCTQILNTTRKRKGKDLSYLFKPYPHRKPDEYEDPYAWITRKWKPENKIYRGRKVA